MTGTRFDIAARTRDWAIRLTERPSVTGTADEAAFGPWFADILLKSATFGPRAEVWTIPVGPGDGRHSVVLFVRGSGRRTVLLTGHFDTVTVEDYGDLRDLAILPERLLPALKDRLAGKIETPAERRAKADFAGHDYLPGRGLLDMKSGLAAGLAVIEEFAATETPQGNILFIAVPDEESGSAGARSAARNLAGIAASLDIEVVAAINLDAIADDGDGISGRSIALGTVGKVLPTAFVAGVPTHGGFPFNGINAATLLSAIVTRLEWAPELTDNSAEQPGTPPSLLSLRDGKTGYDVTTPATAFACWNVLLHRRSPEEALDAFDRLCTEAAAECLRDLSRKAGESALPEGQAFGQGEVDLYRYEHVLAKAQERNSAVTRILDDLGADLTEQGVPLPEQCRQVTERIWRESGLAGPAIVTGFGSIPYLATHLSDTPDGNRLADTARTIAAASSERYGVEIKCTDYFAGISDMSFFGEADEAALGIVSRNTPVWGSAIVWPDGPALGMIPIINAGPWGRDYHTPLERLHTGYAFDILPRVLADILSGLLGDSKNSQVNG
ncbi:MAG: M20/M25/M40 family metallo-hydrolase [Paracoccaceae bacterium]